MKSNTITLRVSEDLRDRIENLAFDNEISFSEMARKLLESNSTPIIEPKKNDLLFDFRFTQLIFWICDKFIDGVENETDEFYQQNIQLIKELQNHPFFTKDILSELNKILAELLYNSIDGRHSNGCFKFSDPENKKGLDYEKFSDFMYSLYFDENNNLVKATDDD